MYLLKCIFLKCFFPKCILAKCTRLACLLSFASLFCFIALVLFIVSCFVCFIAFHFHFLAGFIVLICFAIFDIFVSVLKFVDPILSFLLCFILMKNLSIRFESLNKLFNFSSVSALHPDNGRFFLSMGQNFSEFCKA